MGRHIPPPEKASEMGRRSGLARRARAAGWDDVDAYAAYLDDSDGGRAPCRVHLLPPRESTPCIAEVLSWQP